MSSPEYNIPDATSNGGPSTEIDLYEEAVDPPTGNDDLLDDINLGLGNYSSADYWLQIQSFEKALYTAAALRRTLLRRAAYETKRWVARTGWEWYDEDAMDRDLERAKRVDGYDPGDAGWRSVAGWQTLTEDHDRRAAIDCDCDEFPDCGHERVYVNEYADRLWETLPESERERAMEEKTGLTKDWEPTFLRMLAARHEASRSKGARVLDNLFGRVDTREVQQLTQEELAEYVGTEEGM